MNKGRTMHLLVYVINKCIGLLAEQVFAGHVSYFK